MRVRGVAFNETERYADAVLLDWCEQTGLHLERSMPMAAVLDIDRDSAAKQFLRWCAAEFGRTPGREWMARLPGFHVLATYDFVVYEHRYGRPLLAIEVDGSIHRRRDVVERDLRKNWLNRNAGLPLLRISPIIATTRHPAIHPLTALMDMWWAGQHPPSAEPAPTSTISLRIRKPVELVEDLREPAASHWLDDDGNVLHPQPSMMHPHMRPDDPLDEDDDERSFVERQLSFWLTMEFTYAEARGHVAGHPAEAAGQARRIEIDKVERYIDGQTVETLNPPRTIRSHVALAYIRPDEPPSHVDDEYTNDRFHVVPAALYLAELSLLIQSMEHVTAHGGRW